MSDMKAYLAEKYMSGPKADAILSRVAPKKKKRKTNTAEAGETGATAGAPGGSARVVDDDGPAGWGDVGADDAEDLKEAVVEKDRGFKKRKVEGPGTGTGTGAGAAGGSGWATIQDGVVVVGAPEREPSPVPADEQPVMVEEGRPFSGGLVSARDLHKVLPKAAPVQLTQEEIEASKETVYRDAQGRKIDTKAARAEAARKKREKEEKEALMMEWGKGLVQREDKEKMRLELEKQKEKGFSRYADDADLNEELRAKELWNDPAAAFLTARLSTLFFCRQC